MARVLNSPHMDVELAREFSKVRQDAGNAIYKAIKENGDVLGRRLEKEFAKLTVRIIALEKRVENLER